MTGLYPIIRRARRPLIISDDDSGPPPAAPPAVPLVEPEQPVSYLKVPLARKGQNGIADKDGSARQAAAKR
jgi:hypothetical protein